MQACIRILPAEISTTGTLGDGRLYNPCYANCSYNFKMQGDILILGRNFSLRLGHFRGF